MPLGVMRNVYVKIHKPVETEGRKIGEIRTETFNKVNSGLPPYQQGEATRKKYVPKVMQQSEVDNQNDFTDPGSTSNGSNTDTDSGVVSSAQAQGEGENREQQ